MQGRPGPRTPIHGPGRGLFRTAEPWSQWGPHVPRRFASQPLTPARGTWGHVRGADLQKTAMHRLRKGVLSLKKEACGVSRVACPVGPEERSKKDGLFFKKLRHFKMAIRLATFLVSAPCLPLASGHWPPRAWAWHPAVRADPALRVALRVAVPGGRKSPLLPPTGLSSFGSRTPQFCPRSAVDPPAGLFPLVSMSQHVRHK